MGFFTNRRLKSWKNHKKYSKYSMAKIAGGAAVEA
jgi:hypothetical protein